MVSIIVPFIDDNLKLTEITALAQDCAEKFVNLSASQTRVLFATLTD